MQTGSANYNVTASVRRMNVILRGKDTAYKDVNFVPARSSLTFRNGWYVDASVIYVDIRGSAQLAEHYTRPKLAKLYKCYLSEMVAALRSNKRIHEVYIEGDGVWATYDTPKQIHVDNTLSTVAAVNSVLNVMNYRFREYDIAPIKVGIGVAYGTSLLVKAGYEGSGINELVWIGEVVAEASKLCSFGSRTAVDDVIMVSKAFYKRLSAGSQSQLSLHSHRDCYHGNLVYSTLEDWLKRQEEKKRLR